MATRIGECLPEIFERTNLFVNQDSELLFVASLLRFEQLDAFPITFNGEEKRYAVTDYSCLSRILHEDPKNYVGLLRAPCKDYALELHSVSIEDSVEDLLDTFRESGIGLAWIHEEMSEYGEGRIVSLRDLLPLYEKKLLITNLHVDNVESPLVSMEPWSSLRQLIGEMRDMKVRRVLISGSNKLVSDGSIIRYLFSPFSLDKIATDPESLLEATLDDLEKFRPTQMDKKATVSAAASALKDQIRDCALCDNAILTPWDLVIKPWSMKELTVA